MHKTRANDSIRGGMAELGYAEVDPSGRYGRFKEILGKGAMKTVYKAFDEVLGIEVAWNQVKLNCVLRSPDELQRLYSEVHLLKNLNHSSIMRFYTSWINVDKCTFNFITEMFTAGTLREYRQKYKRVHIRAVKDWARQILEGLTYLHSHDPPVIHRDLKCDNIFVNGHLGQVKIGDLGLAATLCESQHAHSVIGTPEFMAPEMYEEDYNELVDIYSFGMCVLEMLTSQYPYSECSNPAQIYKKVTTGKLPKAYHEIQCPDAKRFIGKCLENASTRPSARELLMEPFLVEDHDQIIITPSQKLITPTPSSLSHDPKRTTDMKITGTMNPDDGSIFLKVFISDKIGKARNIYFPFDVESDTAHDVATEMVKELEIEDWKPLEIAEMIDKEIVNLIPSWKKSPIDLVLQNLDYHSFCYDDDDDDNDDDDHTPHPFRSTSLHSSPHASPRKGCIHLDGLEDRSDGIMIYPTLDLIQGNCYDDDGSSESSLNSCNYSSFTYSSGNEDHEDHSSSFLISQEDPQHLQKTNNFTRFCGEDHKYLTQQKAIKRVKSVVDIRSQSLHRTLVEEIHKRRLFNTVAAIENIGYHEPAW